MTYYSNTDELAEFTNMLYLKLLLERLPNAVSIVGLRYMVNSQEIVNKHHYNNVAISI